MNKDKKTTRSKGEHLKKKEVKIEIIRYILSEDDKVSGPDITKHLLKKYNIVDEKNIRNHLRDLQKQNCIEKIQGKPGLENKWKIEKTENLQNVQKCYPKEHYPDLQLNKYRKSLYIVSKDQFSKGYFLGDYFIYPNKLCVQLFLSRSFFEVCLNKDIKTLYDKAYEYYKYGEGYEKCKYIQNCIDNFYNECIKPISISPKILLDVYRSTSNFLELEIYQSIPKNSPYIKISAEKFREILEDSDMWRFDSNNWESRFVEEFSTKLSKMICQKIRNKISTESTKKWEKELKVKSISILREMIEEIPVALEAPTTNPVLTEKYEEIRALRQVLGKEEPTILNNIIKIINEIQGSNEAPTTNPVPAEILDFALRQVLEKEESDIPNFIYLRELSAKITYEVFQQMFKYIPIEFLDTPEMPKTLIEILKKISQEVLQETQVIPDEMYGLLTEITIHRLKIALSINDITFKHYFDRDIEDGKSSSNERDYIVMMKELHSDLVEGKISSRDVELALDHFLELGLKDAGNT